MVSNIDWNCIGQNQCSKSRKGRCKTLGTQMTDYRSENNKVWINVELIKECEKGQMFKMQLVGIANRLG